MQSHENMDAMAALVCGCLNVRVSFVSGQLRPVSFFQLALAGEEALEAFFKQKLIDVTLDLTGVTKEHAFLTRRKAVGEWFITSCLNCGMAAYAEHVKHSLHKVLVSSHLVRDARTVEEMVRSPQYSPAFRVLLKPKTTDLSPDLGMPFARQDASLERQHELQLINGKSTKFLRQKQLEMEKRIREFADQQKLEFSELQRRTIQDKNVVLGILRSLDEAKADAAPKSNMGDRSPTDTDALKRLDAGITAERPITMQRAPQLQQDNIDRRGEVGKQNSEHAKQGGGGNAAPQPIGRALFDTADGIFDLEGLEEDMVLDHRAFYESEDDLETPETTDDSSNSSSVTEHDHSSAAVNMYGGRPSQSSYQVAQSLPINMPLETQHHQHTAAPTGGDRAYPERPEDMAASIKALAQSVHGHEVFGELPRPRLFSISGRPQ